MDGETGSAGHTEALEGVCGILEPGFQAEEAALKALRAPKGQKGQKDQKAPKV